MVIQSQWLKRGAQVLVLILAVLVVFGCAGVKARQQSFSSFVFSAADNPALSRDVVGAVDWRAKIVTLVVPPGTRVSSLIATYVAPEGASVYVRSQGSTIPQTNGATANDFRRPVEYLLVLEDGTEVVFVVKVREAETNPNLASMTLGDNVAFSPSFAKDVESYNAEVPYAIAELTIRPNAESQYASITIDGRKYPARNAAAAVALRAGEMNAISIVVTAEDGVTTRTYTLNVKRAEPDRDSSLAGLSVGGDTVLTPPFSPDIIGYRISVPYQPEALTFTPTTNSAVATVTVQGIAVPSGSESQPIELGDELITSADIVVTAQDGTTKTTYTVTIQRAEPDRDASLAAIGVSEGASVAPKFSKNITVYEISIPNTMDKVVLTPQASSPVATVTVAGEPLPAGTSLEPIVLAEDSSVEVEILVTAQDKKTMKPYNLKVIRRPIDPSWTQAVGSAGFSSRFGFEAVVFKGKLWVIGGSATNMDYFNDIWYSDDGTTWTRATQNPGFTPRRNHQVVEYKGQLWLFGGETGMYQYENDVWTSKDGVYWTEVDVKDPFPKQVNHQAAVFKGQIWIIGGYGPDSTGSAVWSSKDGKVWTEESREAGFPARDMHQLIAFKNKLWIIGGQRGSVRFGDVWSSSDGVTWTQEVDLSTSGFGARMMHEAAVYAGRMWVSGGYVEGIGAANDVWYTKDGKEWKQATESAEFIPRLGHQMVDFKGRLWIIGGTDNRVARNDVWYSNAKGEPEPE
ncbi:MAG: cadherin-like beta sandwich domain-containing protein [Spirochaetaceae bacterium]|nr:MAG: cadherin-like beta sandwich domain-containing protein [Spirochaetaceae bacterium]